MRGRPIRVYDPSTPTQHVAPVPGANRPRWNLGVFCPARALVRADVPGARRDRRSFAARADVGVYRLYDRGHYDLHVCAVDDPATILVDLRTGAGAGERLARRASTEHARVASASGGSFPAGHGLERLNYPPNSPGLATEKIFDARRKFAEYVQ